MLGCECFAWLAVIEYSDVAEYLFDFEYLIAGFAYFVEAVYFGGFEYLVAKEYLSDCEYLFVVQSTVATRSQSDGSLVVIVDRAVFANSVGPGTLTEYWVAVALFAAVEDLVAAVVDNLIAFEDYFAVADEWAVGVAHFVSFA